MLWDFYFNEESVQGYRTIMCVDVFPVSSLPPPRCDVFIKPDTTTEQAWMKPRFLLLFSFVLSIGPYF